MRVWRLGGVPESGRIKAGEVYDYFAIYVLEANGEAGMVWLQPRPVFMVIAIFIIASLYLLGLAVLACAAWRAPEGFEDERGFHAGSRAVKEDPSL